MFKKTDLGVNSLNNDFVLKINDYQYDIDNPYDMEAATKMSALNDWILKINISKDNNSTTDNINIFLIRLLFCFFSDDIGIFSKSLFSDSIKDYTGEDGVDLSLYLSSAFAAMDLRDKSELNDNVKHFPYVNGGLFSDKIEIPFLDKKSRELILECAELDWTLINPDIFGSMIQSIIGKETRYTLGIHYTSIPNIMRLIRPLFLDELYNDFNKYYNNRKKLNSLLNRISTMKFFDPACGNGNFLIVAYKELRIFEIKIWKRIRELSHGQMSLPFVSITLEQLYGIEIDGFICQTAMISLWLVEHQMNAVFKEEFSDVSIDVLPLKTLNNIHCANSCHVDWNKICPNNKNSEIYILGNPPFIGSKMQSLQQRLDSESVLRDLKNNKILDYIANWFWLASRYVKDSNSKFAFVSTNSISQGEQVSILWKPIFDLGLTISFAHTSFLWSNNAKDKAGVICVIIGVDSDKKSKKYLYDNGKQIIAKSITPYLTAGNPIAIEKSYKQYENLPKISYGSMAYDNGNLLLSAEEKESLISEFPQSEDLIMPIVGARELISGSKRYCLWIDNSLLETALNIPVIKDKIDKTALFRSSCNDNKGKELAKRPHQFREFTQLKNSAIIIPRVSSHKRKYIPIGYSDKKIVISDSAYAIYDAPLWIFGVLSSYMHNLWIKSIGGRLKNDLRYSGQLCYNCFPFPRLSNDNKLRIEEIVKTILDIRDRYKSKNLAWLYDVETMPIDLSIAHAKLDRMIESFYGIESSSSSDSEKLTKMFEEYNKRLQKLEF